MLDIGIRLLNCSCEVWDVWCCRVSVVRIMGISARPWSPCWACFCVWFPRFLPCVSLTDSSSPGDPLPTAHHALQEVTLHPRPPTPLFSSHPAPDIPHQLPLEVRVCMAGQAPPLTDQGSMRGALGGRSTQQRYTIKGQGAPQGPREVEEGTWVCQPGALTPRAVPGRTTNPRVLQRDPSAPWCESQDLQSAGSAWLWDSCVHVSVNGGAPPGNLLDRLEPRDSLPKEGEQSSGISGQCCPSRRGEGSTEHSSTAFPGPWKSPGPDRLPGTLRSWTSTVSR